MIRRPPRSTLDRSSAASDVYKRQGLDTDINKIPVFLKEEDDAIFKFNQAIIEATKDLSLIHISEPTRPY